MSVSKSEKSTLLLQFIAVDVYNSDCNFQKLVSDWKFLCITEKIS